MRSDFGSIRIKKSPPAWHAKAKALFAAGVHPREIAKLFHRSREGVYWVLDIDGSREKNRERVRKRRSREKPVVFENNRRSHNFIKLWEPKPLTPMSIQEARRQRTMKLCIAFAHYEITRAELSMRLRAGA